MLFNSVIFIAGFLPVVLFGFIILAGTGRQRYAAIWLTLASLVFYGWWNPAYVPLLVGSMVANYLIGGYLMRRPSRLLLILGVAANVALLGYYKYTGFLFGSLDSVSGWVGQWATSSCRWRSRSSPFSRSPIWWMPTMAK